MKRAAALWWFVGGWLLPAAVAAAAVLSPALSHAQGCEPKGFGNATAPGSPVVLHVTAQGAAGAWWCPEPGGGAFRASWYGGTWLDAAGFITGVAPRVLSAADRWAAFRAEATAAGTPAAGTLAACRVAELSQAACVKLVTTSGPPYPGPFTVAQANEPRRCGPPPNCAPSGAPAWVVDAATAADDTRPAYSFVGGVRAKTSTARATAGQPCRPEIAQAPSGVAGKVFAAYGPAFNATLVALCRRP